MLASIPTACIGLVKSLTGLIFVRLFIGLAGSTFVMCQCWTTRMFTKDIVGVANGLVGGWGNVGGGATQLIMGTLLFPLFTLIWGGGGPNGEDPEEMAWRTVTIVPAVLAFCSGALIIRTSDDCPKGQYKELKRSGVSRSGTLLIVYTSVLWSGPLSRLCILLYSISQEMPEVSAAASFRTGAININTWLLYLQYACCFGVELTVNNAAVTYFVTKFELPIATASAIASVFGFMVRKK